MGSQWQPVMQACMHWLYDTLHSGVLLKFPSFLPFCSAGGIMFNNKKGRWLEPKQEPGFPRRRARGGTAVSPGRSRWRYAGVSHFRSGRNRVGGGIIAFKLHEGCFDYLLVCLPLPPAYLHPFLNQAVPPAVAPLPLHFETSIQQNRTTCSTLAVSNEPRWGGTRASYGKATDESVNKVI